MSKSTSPRSEFLRPRGFRPAHAGREGFRPELCCNLPVTAPSQNPPVVPRQASKVPLQRGLHAAVQRALGHNEDLEQVSAAFEVIQHAVDFRHIAKTVFRTKFLH